MISHSSRGFQKMSIVRRWVLVTENKLKQEYASITKCIWGKQKIWMRRFKLYFVLKSIPWPKSNFRMRGKSGLQLVNTRDLGFLQECGLFYKNHSQQNAHQIGGNVYGIVLLIVIHLCGPTEMFDPLLCDELLSNYRSNTTSSTRACCHLPWCPTAGKPFPPALEALYGTLHYTLRDIGWGSNAYWIRPKYFLHVQITSGKFQANSLLL